jgi:hypothetical protein
VLGSTPCEACGAVKPSAFRGLGAIERGLQMPAEIREFVRRRQPSPLVIFEVIIYLDVNVKNPMRELSP